jgi:hypothetical protein
MPKGVAGLFEVPLADFVEARNALVRELKAAGQADEAKRIAALRKPSKALWLVNQLARRRPKELQAFIDATARVSVAQHKGAQVREAMQAQRDALAALTEGEAEVDRATLQSAAMSEPDALQEGRLLHELSASGFDALLAVGVQAAAVEKQKAAPPRVDPEIEKRRLAAQKKAAELAARADELEKLAAVAERAASKAREEADAARAKADEAKALAAAKG